MNETNSRVECIRLANKVKATILSTYVYNKNVCGIGVESNTIMYGSDFSDVMVAINHRKRKEIWEFEIKTNLSDLNKELKCIENVLSNERLNYRKHSSNKLRKHRNMLKSKLYDGPVDRFIFVIYIPELEYNNWDVTLKEWLQNNDKYLKAINRIPDKYGIWIVYRDTNHHCVYRRPKLLKEKENSAADFNDVVIRLNRSLVNRLIHIYNGYNSAANINDFVNEEE